MSIAAIVANVIATARARAFHPRARIGCLLCPPMPCFGGM
jgi:hypothetical protein